MQGHHKNLFLEPAALFYSILYLDIKNIFYQTIAHTGLANDLQFFPTKLSPILGLIEFHLTSTKLSPLQGFPMIYNSTKLSPLRGLANV